MTIEERFREIVALLRRENLRFAVAGGLAASVYRDQPRSTGDLDFLIYAKTGSVAAAEKIVHAAGLHAAVARQADLEGGPIFARKRNSTPPVLVVGRDRLKTFLIGVDFILPDMPWFEPALERAQINQIEFGFGKVPCLTVEDVIVAKLYALKNDPKRLKDLDDLQAIFRSRLPIDSQYLAARMQTLFLPFPREIEPALPDPLRKVSKTVRKRRS